MDWIDTLDWSLVVQTLQFAATGYICGLVKKELEGPFHKLQNLEAADKLKERKKGKGTEDAVQKLILELKNEILDVLTQPEAPKAAKAPDAEKAPKAKKAEEATEAPKAEETKAEKTKKAKKAAAAKKAANEKKVAEKKAADEKAAKIAKIKAELEAAEND